MEQSRTPVPKDTIFDDLNKLQDLSINEKDMRQTFERIFDEQISQTTQSLIKTHLQKQFKAKSDIDVFKYLIAKEKIEMDFQQIEIKQRKESDLPSPAL